MKRLVVIFLAVVLIMMMLSGCVTQQQKRIVDDVVDRMNVGWNLGNTMDNIDYKRNGTVDYYETLWGNPVTTKEMIHKVKEAGFGAVRIPVTWYDHVDENNKIDEKWIARVQEIVQYVLDEDLFCIINLHHDTGKTAWIKADVQKKEEMEQLVQSLWSQIAQWFQSYEDHLLFEGMNEILNNANQWGDASDEELAMVNDLNQVFVDTVRQSGGQNTTRFLIVNTYAASTDQRILDAFSMPKDNIEDHLIAEVHFYGYENRDIDAMLERLDRRFIQNQIPVIIGECGMVNNPEIEGFEQKRLEYASYFFSKSREMGITCFWWDNGGKFQSAAEVTSYALLNRQTCEWYDNALVETIVQSSHSKE